jgi:hypothetical protein
MKKPLCGIASGYSYSDFAIAAEDRFSPVLLENPSFSAASKTGARIGH